MDYKEQRNMVTQGFLSPVRIFSKNNNLKIIGVLFGASKGVLS